MGRIRLQRAHGTDLVHQEQGWWGGLPRRPWQMCVHDEKVARNEVVAACVAGLDCSAPFNCFRRGGRRIRACDNDGLADIKNYVCNVWLLRGSHGFGVGRPQEHLQGKSRARAANRAQLKAKSNAVACRVQDLSERSTGHSIDKNTFLKAFPWPGLLGGSLACKHALACHVAAS